MLCAVESRIFKDVRKAILDKQTLIKSHQKCLGCLISGLKQTKISRVIPDRIIVCNSLLSSDFVSCGKYYAISQLFLWIGTIKVIQPSFELKFVSFVSCTVLVKYICVYLVVKVVNILMMSGLSSG
jgi:hypothetical protein